MITAADVGIGISGLEGQQAVKASDYAIGKFKFLKNLLFVHGREAYRRNSFAVVFIFYKNIMVTSPIFFFGIVSLFSGSILYHLTLYNSFNTFYTCLPIIWLSTMDFEYTKDKLLETPALYKYGMRNLLFNYKIFFREIGYGFGQAAVLTFFAHYYFTLGSSTPSGMFAGYTEAGDFIFLCLVVVCNTRVLVSSHEFNWGAIGNYLISFVIYLATAVVVAEIFWFDDQYHTFYHIFYFPNAYMALLLFTCVFAATDKSI